MLQKTGIITLMLVLLFSHHRTWAQKEITMGTHISKGNGNTSITKGEGIGEKMKAGKKTVLLQSLNMNLTQGTHPDSVNFYVRVFPLSEKTLGNNIAPDSILTVSLKDGQIHASLTDLHIRVSGNFVLGIEWAKDVQGTDNKISFPTGLLKKGIYYKDNDDSKWKKVPLFGLDMVVRGIEQP